MHNFYPRVDTGLDVDYCIKCTDYIHEHGGEVWAFVSGDEDKRGSVFEGLPTIERYRYLPPYVQYCLLKNRCSVDDVFLGDISMTNFSSQIIHSTESDGVLRLPCDVDDKFADELFYKVFTIRADSNSIVARIRESRGYASAGDEIAPYKNNEKRSAGSITIDNINYSVYSGEVQICLKDLCPDNRVNVIGSIDENYIGLLELCCRNQKIMFVPSE